MTDVHCPRGGRHEFEWTGRIYRCKKGCKSIIGPAHPRAVSWLNAAMQLTADEAEEVAQALKLNGYLDTKESSWVGRYARRWQGDTEENEDE